MNDGGNVELQTRIKSSSIKRAEKAIEPIVNSFHLLISERFVMVSIRREIVGDI